MSAAVTYIGLAHGHEPPPGLPSSVTFVGSATALLRMGDIRILYDPCFLPRGARTPIGLGQRALRYGEPACDLEELLPVDFVVVSHLQGDHFDDAAARALPRYVPIVTNPHAAKRLRGQGFDAGGLSTWSSRRASRDGQSVRITALPASCGPRAMTGILPPAMGTMLEFLDADDDVALRVYLSGDMLCDEDLLEIATQFPEIDLALVHLGGSRALGVPTSMDARDGLRALRLLRPANAIPIHYEGYDSFTSTLADFQRLVDRAGLPTSVTYLAPGEVHRLSEPVRRRPPAA